MERFFQVYLKLQNFVNLLCIYKLDEIFQTWLYDQQLYLSYDNSRPSLKTSCLKFLYTNIWKNYKLFYYSV